MKNQSLVELINEEKIDSRLKYGSLTHPTQPLERTFCVVCGNPYGWVSTESSQYIRANNIVVVCDSCHASLGELPLKKANIEVQP